MDETSTRLLIDQMLRDAGWEADSARLTHAQGTRPERHRHLAIAEWPTQAAKVPTTCCLRASRPWPR